MMVVLIANRAEPQRLHLGSIDEAISDLQIALEAGKAAGETITSRLLYVEAKLQAT